MRRQDIPALGTSMTHEAVPTICYLCGKPLGRDRTRDHVPPQSFFPPALRRQKNFSRLDTVWAHAKCNGAFKIDEQYFFHSLAPLARRTEAGPAIWNAIDKPIITPHELRLRRQIAGEFSVDRWGRVHKTFDQKRIYRIIRKIIRGLWFLRFHTVLSNDLRCDIRVYDPNNRPPQVLLNAIESEPSWGFYPEVFFFKALRSDEQPIQAWTFVLWDWFVITAVVHEAACKCELCPPP
jgi:hypothetical protein